MNNDYNKTEYHTDFDPFGDTDSSRNTDSYDNNDPFMDFDPFRPLNGERDWSWPNLLSWGLDAALLYLLPVVGVVFTAAHALGHDWLGDLFRKIAAPTKEANPYASKTSASQRQKAPQTAKSTAARQSNGTANTHTVAGADKTQAKAAGEDKAKSPGKAPEKKSKTAKKNRKSLRLLWIFGWVLVALGLALLVLNGDAMAAGAAVSTLLRAGAVALSGGAMLLADRLNLRRENTFKRCLTVCGDAGVVEISKLSATLGFSEDKTNHLLGDMLDKGHFGPRAYIDHQRNLLVIRPEDMRDVYRREDEAKAQTAREQMDEYQRWLADIRQADVDIDDEVMSEKIRQMESITKGIFDEIRLHPEKHSQITRFMNYYLPTTLKLLNSYARIEKQGVSGENMARAKQDIEGIADTLIDGYKKQLDNLYRSESLDIAGDVAVLEKLMNNGPAAGSSAFASAAAAQTQEV